MAPTTRGTLTSTWSARPQRSRPRAGTAHDGGCAPQADVHTGFKHQQVHPLQSPQHQLTQRSAASRAHCSTPWTPMPCNSSSQTRIPAPPTHTRTRTRTRTHTRTRTRTLTHTHNTWRCAPAPWPRPCMSRCSPGWARRGCRASGAGPRASPRTPACTCT